MQPGSSRPPGTRSLPLAPDPCPPPPPAKFEPPTAILPARTLLCRIHSPKHSPAGFNPWQAGGASPTRFAPFDGPDGDPVPTLYAAPNFSVALAESLFHDLPRNLPDIFIARSKVDALVVSWIRPLHDLRLASFRGPALRRLRVEWNQLIGSLPTCYSRTQLWARAAHRLGGDVQGIEWSSRQYDGEASFLLFGDRIDLEGLEGHEGPTAIEIVEDRIPLGGPRYETEVLRECEQADITLVSA